MNLTGEQLLKSFTDALERAASECDSFYIDNDGCFITIDFSNLDTDRVEAEIIKEFESEFESQHKQIRKLAQAILDQKKDGKDRTDLIIGLAEDIINSM